MKTTITLRIFIIQAITLVVFQLVLSQFLVVTYDEQSNSVSFTQKERTSFTDWSYVDADNDDDSNENFSGNFLKFFNQESNLFCKPKFFSSIFGCLSLSSQNFYSNTAFVLPLRV